MELSSVTWVVVADHEHARLFEERRSGGPLHELQEVGLDGSGAARPSHAQATVHDRFGHGRHGSEERSGPTEDEWRFARRLADVLEEASQCGAFEQFAIFAPARTLGLVRDSLSRPLARKLAMSEPRFCIREDAPEIRERLRAARAQA